MTFEQIAWLSAMGLLILFSGFFSSSEAALFLLNAQQRRELAEGGRRQRLAAKLLEDSDRLLTAILFWNLVVNVTYFAMASIASLRLEAAGQREYAGGFALVSLLTIIMFAEMLPKSLAVLQPRRFATWLSIPLAAAVRVVEPIIPALRLANLVSRRVIWPRFKPEPYLEVADLERAVQLSTTDATLLQQEKTVLQSIVALSTMRVDELMRPRTQFVSFRPPVSLDDLAGRAAKRLCVGHRARHRRSGGGDSRPRGYGRPEGRSGERSSPNRLYTVVYHRRSRHGADAGKRPSRGRRRQRVR